MVKLTLNCEHYWFVCFLSVYFDFDSCILQFLRAVLVCDIEKQAILGSNELIRLLFCSRVLIEVKRQRSMSFGL